MRHAVWITASFRSPSMQTTRNSCASSAAPSRPPSPARIHGAKVVGSVRPTRARPPVETKASWTTIEFTPGPWTAQLFLLTYPGMAVSTALRRTKAIHRAHSATTAPNGIPDRTVQTCQAPNEGACA